MEHENLSRIWLLRLVKEYKNILYWYRIKGLSPANLRLGEGTSTLGTWNAESRTISISRNMIAYAPWEVVCQILRHEMAHQIADERLGGDDGHCGPTHVSSTHAANLKVEAHLGKATVEEVKFGECRVVKHGLVLAYESTVEGLRGYRR